MDQSMATITIVEYYGEINAEFGVITFGKMPFFCCMHRICVKNASCREIFFQTGQSSRIIIVSLPYRQFFFCFPYLPKVQDDRVAEMRMNNE